MVNTMYVVGKSINMHITQKYMYKDVYFLLQKIVENDQSYG